MKFQFYEIVRNLRKQKSHSPGPDTFHLGPPPPLVGTVLVMRVVGLILSETCVTTETVALSRFPSGVGVTSSS